MSMFMSAVPPPREYRPPVAPPPVATHPFAAVAPISNTDPDLLMPVLPPAPAPTAASSPSPPMPPRVNSYSFHPAGWSFGSRTDHSGLLIHDRR